MPRTRLILPACFLFSTAGCIGTEAGNPDPEPLCSSFMFGLIEGEFAVPENASGIPLQLSESVRMDATASFEFAVTRNGVEEGGWQLVDRAGSPVDPAAPFEGRILAVPTAPLAEGDRILLRRGVTCRGPTGDPIELTDDDVVVTVAPAATLPTAVGDLRVASDSSSSTVVLTVSPELLPWLHLITRSALRVGDTMLPGGFFLDGGDRNLEWRLSTVDCRPCPAEPGEGDGPPRTCQAHQWLPGQYELVVEVELAGESDVFESKVMNTGFDTVHCSP